MDIHRMKCFLRLAEELSFSRAAEKQCMAQSTMSQQIQNMEEELGTRVFIRNNRKVTLTPAGEFLQREFSRLIKNYEGIVHEARRISGTGENQLTIGYHGPFDWIFLNPIFQSFKSTQSQVRLSVSMENWGDIVNKIVTGEIDIGFLAGSELEGNSLVESCFLYRDYICFALHKSHPLAGRSILRAQDIEKEALAMVDTSIGKKSIKMIHQRLIQADIDIRKGPLMKNFESCMAMVSTGNAISPMPRSFKQNNLKEVVFIDYESPDAYVDFHMAWRNENKNKALTHFIENVKSTYIDADMKTSADNRIP